MAKQRATDNSLTDEEKVNAKKKFHIKDLINICPLTAPQKDMVYAVSSDDYGVILASGSAGTGKTFLGLYLALKEVLSGTVYKKCVIIRSCVPARDIGFLPGTQQEKEQAYQEPYINIVKHLFDYTDYKKCYERLVKLNYIEFMSTSFLRG